MHLAPLYKGEANVLTLWNEWNKAFGDGPGMDFKPWKTRLEEASFLNPLDFAIGMTDGHE